MVILLALHAVGKGHIASFLPRADSERLDARQSFTLQPFEEGAPGGGDVGEAICRASGVERGDRITATCHSYNFSGGGEPHLGFRDPHGTAREALECTPGE